MFQSSDFHNDTLQHNEADGNEDEPINFHYNGSVTFFSVGTITDSSNWRTIASAPFVCSVRKCLNTSRWLSTGTACALISSGVTNGRPCNNALACEARSKACIPLGLTPIS